MITIKFPNKREYSTISTKGAHRGDGEGARRGDGEGERRGDGEGANKLVSALESRDVKLHQKNLISHLIYDSCYLLLI